MLGALRAGFVVVNTNPLYTAPELEHQLQDSGATAIVILENFAHVLQKVIASHQGARRARHGGRRFAGLAEILDRQLRRAQDPKAGTVLANSRSAQILLGFERRAQRQPR